MEHARLNALSSADYLARELASDVRHEFVAGQVFAKTGARDSHNSAALNIASLLQRQLRGRCRVFIGDVKLRVEAADAYYYPDVFATCDARDNDPYVKRYASLVIEVLSPSTEGVDRREKLRSYRLLDTVQEYAIVSIEERTVEVYRREALGEWHLYKYHGNERIDLTSFGASIDVAAVFEGVD